MKINKTIIIPIVFLLIGAGLVFIYNQANNWVAKEKIKAQNAGVITAINQIYDGAVGGEIGIKSFLVDDNGRLIRKNGVVQRGETIILIIKEE